MKNDQVNEAVQNGPIRVLQVIGIMNRGGAETMIMNLYRKIDRSKVQFDFIENSSESATFDDEIESLGGRIYRCPHFNGKNYFQYKKWWNDFFKQHKGEYHIIHGHLGSTAAIYLKIAKKNGLFTIAHSHNTKSNISLGSMVYRLFSFRTRFIADYFFACSRQAGVDRFGKKVIDSNNYKTFNNAIDTSVFKYDSIIRKDIRKELDIRENEIVVGHVGRFESQKNHEFLIDVFEKLLCNHNNSRLVMVGDGILRKRIEDKLIELDIDNNVVFTGVRSDVNDLLQAMDVFVFPSLYEGFGIVLIEAQTSGLPCIVSDKVASDGLIIDDLISVMSLNQSAEEWAQHIISRLGEKRHDRTAEIKTAGYDISTTSKELMDFYLNIEYRYEQ